jgi:hypothetical protein
VVGILLLKDVDITLSAWNVNARFLSEAPRRGSLTEARKFYLGRFR